MSLLDATLRSSALLLVGLGVAGLLRHQTAALRHWVLAVTVFAAAVVVPLGYALPSWHVTVPLTGSRVQGVTAARVRATEPAVEIARPARPVVPFGEDALVRTPSVSAITAVWLIGCAVACGVLAVRLARLMRLSARAGLVHEPRWLDAVRRTSAAYGIRRPIALLRTDTPDLLATWGVRRPRVLLPATAPAWVDDRIHVVLCHELAHIRRHDWLVQMTADLVRSVYWFNPLMWIACAWLRRESELACDDEVMDTGVAAPDYAGHLLELARMSRRELAVPMARRSTLERRITVMLKNGLNRRALSRRMLVAVTALILAVALPAAALRARQGGPLPLSGVVYDQSGGVLPGITVQLQDAQEFKWEATTNASGHFEFPPVQPGRYAIAMSLPGFKTFRDEFTLKDARDWDRAVTLQVGELTETVTVVTARPPATRSQPGPTAPGPVRVRVGGNIKAPLKLVNINPVYPDSMRDAGRSGIVPIEAMIGVDGAVVYARVLGASVHPDFAKSALDAVRQWQFSPTLLNGAPVEVVMKVTVNFALE